MSVNESRSLIRAGLASGPLNGSAQCVQSARESSGRACCVPDAACRGTGHETIFSGVWPMAPKSPYKGHTMSPRLGYVASGLDAAPFDSTLISGRGLSLWPVTTLVETHCRSRGGTRQDHGCKNRSIASIPPEKLPVRADVCCWHGTTPSLEDVDSY